jgi:2-keto-4-pentenoate hydratase/2-oxohepta-3-ene-1,7-dioic acid hydratase in catechol pathway
MSATGGLQVKFVRFAQEGQARYGVLEGELIQVVEGDVFGTHQVTNARLALGDATLVTPCQPSKILAVGLNYQSHLQGRPAPENPIFFLKANSALLPHGGTIIMPPDVGRVDSEGELVVVIKRQTKRVPRTQVFDYILGYTCGNDVSARVYQRGDGQWMRAKSIDTFAPLGPCIETDLDPGKVELHTRINGEVVQHANTADLIFDVPFLVSYISSWITLLPGDVIYTGTPGTTSAMRDGDVVEVDLAGIGILRNPVKAE